MNQSLAHHVQMVPRPVVSFKKTYSDGTSVEWHAHPRIQLLYATSGAMLAQTEEGSWVVPTGYGLVIPGGVQHRVDMFGNVALCSIYIEPIFVAQRKLAGLKVIKVSDLLAAAIVRFAERPQKYTKNDVAHHLASVIAIEIADTLSAPYAVTLPTRPSLRGICEHLLAQPNLRHTIDYWAEEAGMSRRAFTRAFKKETGISFDHWRQRLRYQIATIELAKGLAPAQVAENVGYGTVSALKTMMTRLA